MLGFSAETKCLWMMVVPLCGLILSETIQFKTWPTHLQSLAMLLTFSSSNQNLLCSGFLVPDCSPINMCSYAFSLNDQLVI